MIAAPALGEMVGPYRLEAVLGEGAVGIVYRAMRADGTVVALKVLKPALSENEDYRRRFAHEARAAADVKERHLVPIVDAGEADGRSYLAVTYYSGRSLEDRLRNAGPLALPDVVRLLSGLAAGLDALHRGGLVHRDIKPSNVMFGDDGAAALTDFGLAKGPAYTVLTKPGEVMGTLDYLAPELIRGEAASPASDVYALGCVVFECLAGEPPFAGRSLFEVGAAHIGEAPPDPCADRPDAPAGLSWAVLKGLAKDPAERPRTATAYAHLVRVAASTR